LLLGVIKLKQDRSALFWLGTYVVKQSFFKKNYKVIVSLVSTFVAHSLNKLNIIL
jgi:hypothetical protein